MEIVITHIKTLIVSVFFGITLYGMEKPSEAYELPEKAQAHRVRSSLGLYAAHHAKARRKKERYHPDIVPGHGRRSESPAIAHAHSLYSVASDSCCDLLSRFGLVLDDDGAQNEGEGLKTSAFLRVIDSPHSALSTHRFKSPAICGLLGDVLQRPFSHCAENGEIILNFHPEEVLSLNTVASYGHLSEQELLAVICPHIQQCGAVGGDQVASIEAEPIKLSSIIERLVEYAQESDEVCVAIVSIQCRRYLIAKNGDFWVFGDLQNQSEQKGYQPGSHYVIVDTLKSLINRLERAWARLQTGNRVNVLDSECGVEFYSEQPHTLLKVSKYKKVLLNLINKRVPHARVFLAMVHDPDQPVEHSTITLAIDSGVKIPEPLFEAVRRDIHTEDMPYVIEVIDLCAADEKLKNDILEQSVVWQDDEPI